MADPTPPPPGGPPPPARRRRSDARRSIDAILGAAGALLGERPDATMEDIASAAGVTRQTVYAHFPSRDALLAALVSAAAAEYDGMLDDAGLDTAPPLQALALFLSAGWRLLEHHPFVANAGLAGIPRPTPDPHAVVPLRLERLLRRGQQTGDFDPSIPAPWLTAAIFGLQHVSAFQVTSGQLPMAEAEALCADSTLRLCGAKPGA